MADKVKITKRVVDALKTGPERFMVWDSEISGFGLRVSPADRKVYLLKYRVGGGRTGRVRWATIGTHGNLTPDQAREIARRWTAEVAEGGDPAGVREEQRKAPTVSDLLDRYLKDHVTVRNKAKTVVGVTDLVNRIIRPKLGKLKVADVSRADVSRFHSGLSKTPTTANRALAALSKAFSLAEVWGYRDDHTNPCHRVQRFEERARERFLSAEEFGALGAALSRAEREPLKVVDKAGKEKTITANPEAVRAIRLLIFTGARVGEILGLRWEYLDLEAGLASLPDSKTGKKVVQLAQAALEVLAGAERPETGKGFVIRGGSGKDPEIALVNIKDPWGAIRSAAGLGDVRLHDLRHAFASVAVAGGMSLPMIGALLGHREAKTTQRYAHLANDPQKAAAGQIAGRISEAMNGPGEGGQVVPFHRKG